MIITSTAEPIRPEAQQKYDAYIKNHIDKVHKGFIKYGKELCDLYGINYEMVKIVISGHDRSKWSAAEYEGYLNHFYPVSEESKNSPEVEEAYQKAWLAHIHNNPHHPQHWVLYDDNKVTVFDMPECFILEMILDWDSFKKEDGTGGAYDYYYKGEGKNKLITDKTRELLIKGLEVVK